MLDMVVCATTKSGWGLYVGNNLFWNNVVGVVVDMVCVTIVVGGICLSLGCALVYFCFCKMG